MMLSERQVKKDIVHFSQKLYQKGFVANHDGNISVRVGDRLWATPTAQSKGDVTEDMLVSVDQKGKKLTGKYNIFSEIDLHLSCYRLRPDINVVIHAHPPMATSFACAGVQPHDVFIAEAVVTLGQETPLVPFIPPGCSETEKTLSNYLPYADVFLLKRHGVLSVGKDLAQAYYRLELVEHLCNIEFKAKQLGGVKALPQAILDKLLRKRDSAGLGRPKKVSQTPKMPIEKIVEEEVRKLLGEMPQ
jgi:L-fuculose-phosphate aldolase